MVTFNAATTQPIRNVLIVMPLAEQRGGGELTLLNLIEHGRSAGIKWTIAFFADGPMVGLVRKWGVDTQIVPAGRLRQPHRMIAAILRLRKLIAHTHADVIFSWMPKAQLYSGVAAVLAGATAGWYQHGLPDPPSLQDRVATMLPARIVLACSNTSKRAQQDIWPHRPTKTVYPGVDLSRFDIQCLPTPTQCRAELGLPPSGPLIGMVGRLQRWKGMHHLISAMPAVLARHPDAHAVIVGGAHAFEPDYPEFLKQHIRAIGVADHVILAGLQSNVPTWMQAMDVVVHASDNEPFGIVVIEGMALGKCVIATQTAGPAEIISDRMNGMLWRCGDTDQLTECILLCLGDSRLAAAMGAEAVKRAHAFSVEQFAANVVKALTQL